MNIFTLSQQPERDCEIARLLHSEWSDLANWSSLSLICERLQQRNQPECATFTLLACERDNRLMGTASVIEYELADDPARRYWLGEVFTDAHFRGQGVGSRLTAACIQQAREKQIAQLWLYTPDQQRLYYRLGWREIERREVSGEWVSVMMRDLFTQPD